MTERWRLVEGRELYDIVADPSQRNDVAAKHPEVVQRLTAEHVKWFGFAAVLGLGLNFISAVPPFGEVQHGPASDVYDSTERNARFHIVRFLNAID